MPILVGILVAGRAGVALAVRQAGLVASGEMDGLVVSGVEPIRFTLGPPLLAMLLMSFALTVWVGLVSVATLTAWLWGRAGVPPSVVVDGLRQSLHPGDLVQVLAKPLLFAVVIALIATVCGLTAGRDPQGVARAATRTMIGAVTAILLWTWPSCCRSERLRPCRRPPEATSSDPAVELDGVFQHVAGRCALEGVTLRLDRGDWLLLVGPNGAGKTLLTRLILGLDGPSAGTGAGPGAGPRHPRAQGPCDRLRGQVGAVLQGGSLLEGLTVLDNLLLPLRQTGATRAEMARAARLAITQLQLDGLEGELPRGLSLGLRRRVELARALIHRPSLLVWDGLTEGLDPAGVRETLDLLRQQHANRELTLIATDNRPAELLVDGTRVAVLARGRLLFDGPPQALTEAAQRDLELRYVLAGHP